MDLRTDQHQEVRQLFSQLQSMSSALETAERMAPTHPHPHGLESALGNMIVGPFVAIVDRARDALRGNKGS